MVASAGSIVPNSQISRGPPSGVVAQKNYLENKVKKSDISTPSIPKKAEMLRNLVELSKNGATQGIKKDAGNKLEILLSSFHVSKK